MFNAKNTIKSLITIVCMTINHQAKLRDRESPVEQGCFSFPDLTVLSFHRKNWDATILTSLTGQLTSAGQKSAIRKCMVFKRLPCTLFICALGFVMLSLEPVNHDYEAFDSQKKVSWLWFTLYCLVCVFVCVYKICMCKYICKSLWGKWMGWYLVAPVNHTHCDALSRAQSWPLKGDYIP